MRFLAALGLVCFLASGTLATAQVSVSARIDQGRSDFLLYERLDFLVTVTNTSEADLLLDNNEGHPWLSFVVTNKDHLPVRPERQAVFKPLTLKVGESKTLRVNLTPLFAFREEGKFAAAAVIDLPGAGEVMSEDVPFTVLRGHPIWSQQRPIDGTDRIYSLIRFSPKPNATELYLRVEDPSDNIVYANVGLGEIEAYVDPQVSFDPQGNIHILHLLAMSTYMYTRADDHGKVLHQGVFKTYQEIPPRLAKMEDGNVFVDGGLEEKPGSARETLSSGQRDDQTGELQAKAPAPSSQNISSALPASPPDAAPLPLPAASEPVGTQAYGH